MYTIFVVLFLALAAVPEPINGQTVSVGIITYTSGPTRCKRFRGRSEFRCGKSNYQADSITVRSSTNQMVTFQVGKWRSICGKTGTKYATQNFSVRPGTSVSVEFDGADSGRCGELYVYNCRKGKLAVDCADVITVRGIFGLAS